MGSNPQIAVIVPAFNAERTISRTLESALNQSFGDIEVVVVNDGSTDGTEAVVTQFVERDSRVTMVREANLGVAAARNAGIRNTSAPFIAPLDADDVWSPTKLEKQLARMTRDDAVGLVYAWSRLIDENDRVFRSQYPMAARGHVFPLILVTNFIGTGSSPLIRRELLERIGGYDPSLRARGAEGCEDWKVQILLAGICEFDLVPEFLIGYRRTPACMSANVPMMSRSRQLVLDEMRQRHPELPDHLFSMISAGLSWQAARHLFRQGKIASVSHFARALRLDPAGTLIAIAEVMEQAVQRGRRTPLKGPFAHVPTNEVGWVGNGYGLRRKHRKAKSLSSSLNLSRAETAKV